MAGGIATEYRLVESCMEPIDDEGENDQRVRLTTAMSIHAKRVSFAGDVLLSMSSNLHHVAHVDTPCESGISLMRSDAPDSAYFDAIYKLNVRRSQVSFLCKWRLPLLDTSRGGHALPSAWHWNCASRYRCTSWHFFQPITISCYLGAEVAFPLSYEVLVYHHQPIIC